MIVCSFFLQKFNAIFAKIIKEFLTCQHGQIFTWTRKVQGQAYRPPLGGSESVFGWAWMSRGATRFIFKQGLSVPKISNLGKNRTKFFFFRSVVLKRISGPPVKEKHWWIAGFWAPQGPSYRALKGSKCKKKIEGNEQTFFYELHISYDFVADG